MQLTVAHNAAMSVPYGTAAFQAAVALCALRGIDPHGTGPGHTLENWRYVIAETVLETMLKRELPL